VATPIELEGTPTGRIREAFLRAYFGSPVHKGRDRLAKDLKICLCEAFHSALNVWAFMYLPHEYWSLLGMSKEHLAGDRAIWRGLPFPILSSYQYYDLKTYLPALPCGKIR
jgi:hypothetical protein